MKDFSAMSDFEINLEVAKVVIGAVWFLEKSPRSDNAVLVTNHMGSGERDFDPCNYWNDAGPVIKNYSISLVNIGDEWIAATRDVGMEGYLGDEHLCLYGRDELFSDKNPLRAAMIVFLMMQESK